MRDAFGFVEVKVAHEESALMINVKLVDRVYTEEILVRWEMPLSRYYCITSMVPLVQGGPRSSGLMPVAAVRMPAMDGTRTCGKSSRNRKSDSTAEGRTALY